VIFSVLDVDRLRSPRNFAVAGFISLTPEHGSWRELTDRPSKGAVMYCHGNQMNFYVCAAGFLSPRANEKDFHRKGG
jgi:hypothetical protein